MRFVDNSFITTPDGWEDRANIATQALLQGDISADEQAIIWKEVKQVLASISNARCWYCETSIPRTDNAIDHFRPKGQVRGVRLSEDGNNLINITIEPKHSGYKWLTYDIENFRFSCKHCNEYRKNLAGTHGGKWNYFPLIDEARRAYQEIDLDDEEPALLDPCNVLDWRLFSYDKTGCPFSRFKRGTEEDIRVRLSIRIYHLDQKGLNEARCAQWSLVSPIVRDIKKWYLKKLRRDPGAASCFDTELKKLRQWFHPKSKNSYLGFLVYQLEQDPDRITLHPWITDLLKTLG
ncbi:hypothetical protein [Photorhabdus khanii]|uniref:HNH endonuclease n=1 Tax=Photorhabdus khanii subsp. guanajuatensis TaxID=2100166 RepID=A0A4R4J4U6_9GAMM|nr:hypothetical protein [Photorhabdus khanii]TDB48386.1 hypothetical protein C5467_19120 [Photorhabdus khanii subsp. guanajuatensis]